MERSAFREHLANAATSVGVWGLVGFSGCATAIFFRQLFAESRGPLGSVARAVPLRLFAAAGTALASLTVPRHSRAATALVSLCALVGGLLLRYALVEGGRVSAADPEGYIADTDKPRR